MMNLKHLALACLALLWSCTGTDVGNGIVDVDFAVYDSSESSARAAAAPLAGWRPRNRPVPRAPAGPIR